MEILKQDQYQPMPVEEQVVVLFAAVNGFLDDIPLEAVRDFERRLLAYMREEKGEILGKLREERKLSPELREQLERAVREFHDSFGGDG